MRASCLVLVAVGGGLAIDCRRESAPVPTPSSSYPDGAATASRAVAPASSSEVSGDRYALPDAGPGARFAPLIGAPCSVDSTEGDLCRLCDAHGRVAGVIVPGDFMFLHDDPGIVHRATIGEGVRRIEHTVAVSDGSLRVQVLTCPGCRRVMGWAAYVSLAALKDVDPTVRAELQAAIGYPRAPLLDGERELRATPIGQPGPRASCTPPVDGGR